MQSVGKKSKGAPTLRQLSDDELFKLAKKFWPAEGKGDFKPELVYKVYTTDIKGKNFDVRRIMLLEFSHYLENYLWPNYDAANSSLEHVISIVCLINEKYRERVPAWNALMKAPGQFRGFFWRVMELLLWEDRKTISMKEKTRLLIFLTHCFNSVEIKLVNDQVMKLVSPSLWFSLPARIREKLLKKDSKWKKIFNAFSKKYSKLDDKEKKTADFERLFLPKLIKDFYTILASVPDEDTKEKVSWDTIHYCERFIELLIDLESLLTTRRCFNVVMQTSGLLTISRESSLAHRPEGHLFTQLLDLLEFYSKFEIQDLTGASRTEQDMIDEHYQDVNSLQKAIFSRFPETMKNFYLLNVASVDSRGFLEKEFAKLQKEDLENLCVNLCLIPPKSDEDVLSVPDKLTPATLKEILVTKFQRPKSQMEILNEMPLYPTEAEIWDENLVPNYYFNGDGCLALSKLNLQFLTFHDYLLRNFSLFRMESTYQIRQDLEDALFRMKAWKHESDEKSVVFGGWARMALQINTFSIVEVSKPNLGENSPSCVRADVSMTLGRRSDIRQEWERLRKHDVCFLVTVRPKAKVGARYTHTESFIEQMPVAYVRGCEIEGMVGPDGRVIEEYGTEAKPHIPGDSRTFRVWLDTNQYRSDMEKNLQGGEDVYESFNVIIRRKPKENNFKSVLETMRQLMNTRCVVPDWLHDIILGYGDPTAAHYAKLEKRIPTMDFNDTFLDYEHLCSSFPECQVEPKSSEIDKDTLVPPFRLTFKDLENEEEKKEVLVEPWKPENRGPYPYSTPKKNVIRFTSSQVEAIKSGMEPGLTMVVGPPGTGKTDVAVQIISNIYHNWPEQRTLIVTHSNQALNQLFEKIMQLDIDERHLLRLGHGEEALETEKDFSRYGRVNYVLAQRLVLLKEVERLQKSLGVSGDVAYTCETAHHFFLYQVYARWEEYVSKIEAKDTATGDVSKHFPFHHFFSTAPQPLFKGESYEADFDTAMGCWRHIKRIFDELEEFRAFELLRLGRDRTEYLLVKEAKIIAMTCTHAALRRKDLVALGFHYDNILMEESAQILEIETFIPLLLQDPKDGYNRLKRWIMIGDHHQLPPVIQNMAFQKYCNLEQSLFARFVRLGVPTVLLDSQGRARGSLASLYSWRYKRLDNLPHVESREEFQRANAGFYYDYQLINVENFNGVGESSPSPHFYQNLAEAEYAVGIFMYMRLLGYPAEKISILTTYNGQKHLLMDVLRQRCEKNTMFGLPHKVATVDKFQGQQNDYIILSLVRTNVVGHLRDVRRLIVAMSRARLGLYVLGRVSLFSNCFELTPAFNILKQRPHNLMLVPGETWPTNRKVGESGKQAPVEIKNMPHMVQLVSDFYNSTLKLMHERIQTMKRDKPEPEAPYEGEVKERELMSQEKVEEAAEGRVALDIEFEVAPEPSDADAAQTDS